jgi:hypothetical protein
MSDPRKQQKPKKVEIDDLDVQPETVRDLTDAEAERVEGGLMALSEGCITLPRTRCAPTCIC